MRNASVGDASPRRACSLAEQASVDVVRQQEVADRTRPVQLDPSRNSPDRTLALDEAARVSLVLQVKTVLAGPERPHGPGPLVLEDQRGVPVPIEDLDLDAAAQTVIKEAYKDEVPDVIRYADFVTLWPLIKDGLRAALIDGTYQPRHPEIVETPKSALATRPIAVLKLVDRVVYQAVMDQLGPVIDGELYEEVHSSRYYTTKAGKHKLPEPKSHGSSSRRRVESFATSTRTYGCSQQISLHTLSLLIFRC